MFRRAAALLIATIALGVGGFAASAAINDGPPAGATALCKDGTYSFSQTRSGTCSHHGGVATWLTAGDATTAAATTTPPPPPTTTAAAPTTTAVTTTTATTTAATTTAIASTSTPTSRSKTCGPSYVLAHLSWGDKCLRAGEFCKIGNPEYLKYGFTCPPNGHLRRRR